MNSSLVDSLRAQLQTIEAATQAILSTAYDHKQELADAEWQMVGAVQNLEDTANLITEVIETLEECSV